MIKDYLDLIGNTPVIKYKNIYVKLESFNPSGSIKDRAALSMITNAINNGLLTDYEGVIEATSGNMGISLAYICAIKNISCIIVMPENMSKERIQLMTSYNATVILTPKELGMQGAIDKAQKIAKEKKYLMLDQFNNIYNKQAHYATAQEIISDFPRLDVVVAGIGTGGTISGIAKKLKEHYKDIKIIGVEPFESSVLNHESKGIHQIQGIGAGFIPSILDLEYIDKVERVKSKDAVELTKKLSKEGLFLGISSAAAISVALDYANKYDFVLTIAPDGGIKYMSVLYD